MDLFNSQPSLREQVAELRANLEKLELRDRDFAVSLCTQFATKGDLSPRQIPYVLRLLRTATQGTAAGSKVENLAPVVELFDRAHGNGLKYPKLTFDASAVGVPLQLKRAATGREPGSVFATDGERFGSNAYYGRIGRNGIFTAARDCPAELLPFLVKLGTDTANVAAMYGRASGSCCFCDAELTDERSVHVGYGPVCAKKWGMPYPTAKAVKNAKAGQKDLLAA